MKEFLEIVVRQLVNHPELVSVAEEESETSITLKVSVADEDKGKVIGKDGKDRESAPYHHESCFEKRTEVGLCRHCLRKSFVFGRALDFAE